MLEEIMCRLPLSFKLLVDRVTVFWVLWLGL